MAAADAYNFDEAVNRTRHESALGLPPSDKLFQRMELAGRLVRRHEEDPSLDEDALCKETREAVGLRKVGPVNTKGGWPKLPTALEIMLRAARTAKRGGSLCATTAQPVTQWGYAGWAPSPHRHRRLPDAILVAAPAYRSWWGTAGTSTCRRRH